MKKTNIDNEVDFYGVWNIDKVVLQSKMYTGTVMDGDFEENIYDPADYIGMEIEYDPDYFRLGSEVNYEYLSEVPLLQVEVNLSKEIKYGDLCFIPVGVQTLVLNENTMLIRLWGKILLAYKT